VSNKLVKQHTVSKAYLKHFSINEDGRDLFVINSADKHRPYIQKVDSGHTVFWQKKFYNSDKFATPTDLETFFARDIEPTYSGIINCLKTNIAVSEWTIKLELFQWIIYSKLRSPVWRGYYLQILENSKEFQGAKLDFSKEKLIKELHLTFFTEESLLNEMIEKFANILLSKKWKILIAPGANYWWTTDNPGFGINLDKIKKNQKVLPDPFWNILDNGTLIYFPLSKDYCLQIGPYEKGDSIYLNLTNTDITFEKPGTDLAGLINYWSLVSQEHLLISADREQIEAIASILNNQDDDTQKSFI